MEWYTRAAIKNNEYGYYALAEKLLIPSATIENKRIGVMFMEEAATRGVAAAQYELAEQYSEGGVLASDANEAKKWAERAAAQGYVPAFVKFGREAILRNDFQMASEWFLKAANQDDAYAELMVGIMYLTWKGFGKNLNKSKLWVQKSKMEANHKIQQRAQLHKYFKTNKLDKVFGVFDSDSIDKLITEKVGEEK